VHPDLAGCYFGFGDWADEVVVRKRIMVCKNKVERALEIARSYASHIPDLQPFIEVNNAGSPGNIHVMTAVLASCCVGSDPVESLYARKLIEELGNKPLIEWAQTAAENPNYWKNLKEWFDGSVVTDERGEPLVVYHGTKAKDAFTRFQPHYPKGMQLGFGIHFAIDPRLAGKYADHKDRGRVIPAFIRCRKVLNADAIVDEGSEEYELAMRLKKATRFKPYIDRNPATGRLSLYLQHFIDRVNPKWAEQIIREFGYDGIRYSASMSRGIINNYYIIDEEKYDCFLVFDGSQIKSVFNNGDFSPDCPDFNR